MSAKELNEEYDNVMFNVISGLFQTNKLFQSYLPGSFISGLIKSINQLNFPKVMVSFAIRITQHLEDRLQKGEKIPLFRISYIKVMWRDI